MENTFEHFADHAPQDIRQALKELAEYAAGELDGLNGCEGFGEARIGEVNGVGYAGFIPYQLGGYDATLWIGFNIDESYHLTPSMTDEANKVYKYAYEAALEELALPASTPYDALSDEQQEIVHNFEDEYFSEGALLHFECWLDGKPYNADAPLGPVMMRLSVNYKDAPYFRSKYAEDMHCLNISLEALREAVKRWPDDWCERVWRQLLKSGANNEKEAIGGLDNV